MFQRLRQQWAASQQRQNEESVKKCIGAVLACIDEMRDGTPPQHLYGSSNARILRTELRVLQQHSPYRVQHVYDAMKKSPALQTHLTPSHWAKAEIVFTHLRQDPDVSSP